MHILFKTDTGRLRIVESTDIAYIDGSEAHRCEMVLKCLPDFPIKVGMNIREFHKVLNGADFFEMYKFDGEYEEHPTDSLQKKGLLKNGEASEEEIEQVQKEFMTGGKLVSGNMGEGKLASEEQEAKVQAEIEKKIAEAEKKEIPTFSKKRKKTTTTTVESAKKKSVW